MTEPAPRAWCARLRWKSYPQDREDPARVQAVFASGHMIFSCLDTAEPFGCDDDLAAPERCTPGRSCRRSTSKRGKRAAAASPSPPASR